MDKSIVLVGAGRMGSAMLSGWLNALGNEYTFHVIDSGAADYLANLPMQSGTGARSVHYPSAEALPRNLRVDATVLATKPKMIDIALRTLSSQGHVGSLVISVAAGITIETLSQALHSAKAIARVMPNIGAMVGCSVSAGYASVEATAVQRQLIETLFAAIGSFSWLETEDQLHAVTAVSGSGPAYVFALCEAMIVAGQEQGLSPKTAKALAIGTVCSAGKLLENQPDPTHLRQTVTSPNGTTEAGLSVLKQRGDLRNLVARTIDAAKRRSIELS